MTPTTASVAITAIGMTTPAGLTAAQTCAAVRAGISAIGELDVEIETESYDLVPVNGCAVLPVTRGYFGLGRWTRLATAALRDLVANAGLPEGGLATTGLYLGLPPSARPGVDAKISQLLGRRIARSMGLAGLEARTRVYADGHAAAARACEDAVAHVQQGIVERAIVCGVDSLIEAETLAFFRTKRRLKAADRVDGFSPGEAAACFLVERAEQARVRGVQPLAALEAVSTGNEPLTIWSDEPSPATGLSDAMLELLAQLPDAGHGTGVVVSDLNGEAYRSREFGNAAARVLSAIPTPWKVWHAADCVGDTGAASFTISACIAARGLAKGYANAERALVLGSSDDGLRGAISLCRVAQEA